MVQLGAIKQLSPHSGELPSTGNINAMLGLLV
jgi:hypothetical protein